MHFVNRPEASGSPLVNCLSQIPFPLNPKYAPLLHNLNEQLNFIDLEIDNPIQQCEQAINVILKSIHAVRKIVAKANFKSEGEEIQFSQHEHHVSF